jgi:hypothetical protein
MSASAKEPPGGADVPMRAEGPKRPNRQSDEVDIQARWKMSACAKEPNRQLNGSTFKRDK